MQLQLMMCLLKEYKEHYHIYIHNFLIDIIKKYNLSCSLKFARNFIGWEDSRKQNTPKFTVEIPCQMDGGPAGSLCSSYFAAEITLIKYLLCLLKATSNKNKDIWKQEGLLMLKN